MIRVIEELIRVIAYGGGGALIGYLTASRVNDQHRLVMSVLNESEKDLPTRRRLLSGQTLQTIAVLAIMLALLLTGLVWLQTDRQNAMQDKQDCLRAAETSRTLQERTRNYLLNANAEMDWLTRIRGVLVTASSPDSPLVESTDEYIAAKRSYVRHLRSNPYPKQDAEDC